MRILITGGAGFIGSSLADELLKQGHRVVVLDNFSDYYSPDEKRQNVVHNEGNPKYTLVAGDIEKREDVDSAFSYGSVDIVYHIAARAGVQPSLIDPVAYVKTNVVGTVNVLESMRKHGCRRVVFASSSSVYGNCSETKFSENLKISEPISPYAATKSACEQILYTYSHLYAIRVMCFRFFTVYGPRQRPDLAIRKFTERIARAEPIAMYGNGSTMRDYTFITDIVSGLIAALAYDKTPYEIVNLGGGEPITLSRMIATIEKVLGKKAVVEEIPPKAGDVDKTVCDWSKAKRLIGYEPKTHFEDGVKAFVNWLSEKGKI